MARTRSHRPDAILAFRAYPEGYAAVLCGRRLRLPVIISVRGSDLKMAPSVGPVRAKTEFALRQASAVLAVSQDLCNMALKLGASADRVHVVRNGIHRQVFRPLGKTASRTTLQFPSDARMVLFVGNLLPVKGVTRLVDALAILHRRGAGGLHLVLIGDGNLEPQLRRQATRAKLDEVVHFLGQRSPEEVARWMSAADLLCLPSESEGLPNVILEALSCGCPVVGTTVGGIPELVVPGCGLLVPPGDTAALAQAIQEGLDTSWDSSAIARQPIDSWARVAATTLEHCERAEAEYQAALGDKVRTRWRRGVYSR